MKKLLFLAILLSLLSVSVVKAQSSVEPDPKKQVKDYVRKQMTYPDFGIDQNLQGTVYASFSVNEDGTLKVIEVQSLDGTLKQYVEKKLKEMKVKDPEKTVGQVMDMKFTFNLL